MSDSEAVGLIAGQGTFPIAVARSARARGQRLVCIALEGLTERSIEDDVDEVTWIHLGDAGTGIAAFKAAGVTEACMAGKVPKHVLFGGSEDLRFDGTAQEVMGGLSDRKDDTILGAVADFLEKLGIRLLPQWALAPDLLAGVGPLGSRRPTDAEQADIDFGFPIAKTIGALDIGQTVVVKDRSVLALEAIEGTDAAIRRAGEIAPGGCVVKVEKPNQDARFDVPTIGTGTLDSLEDAKATALAFEAGATVVLGREEVAKRADALGIAIVGVDAKDIPEAIP